MPTDAITLNALASELNKLLQGARIEKIYQPEPDEITLSVRNKGESFMLVVSANPSQPRVHITAQKKENALTAPTFCMLLRKHLTAGFISEIALLNSDRIIAFKIEARNELKDKFSYYLLAEMMGRYSNIILTRDDFIIIDAIKRIHLDQNAPRCILPSALYTNCPQNKTPFNDIDGIGEIFNNSVAMDTNSLLKCVSGMAKETANEVLFRPNALDAITLFSDIFNTDSFKPCVRTEKGIPKDFYVTPYTSFEGDYVMYPTLNEAMSAYFSFHDNAERKKANSKQAHTLLKRLQCKIERRISDNTERLSESEKAEHFRQCGELITANLYRIKSGDTLLSCHNYYTDTEARIALDPLLSPSQNAQGYYKKYTKLKKAIQHAEQQLSILSQQKEYLKSLEIAVENCVLKQEFDEIIAEINALNGTSKAKPSKQKTKPSLPYHIKINGFDVYWGKNNKQNNTVTFEIADGGDTWLHAKDVQGTHMIIKGVPNEDTLLRAAQISAYYSGAKTAEKVAVDFCLKKYVKKIPATMPGMVTYSNFKTLFVCPRKED